MSQATEEEIEERPFQLGLTLRLVNYLRQYKGRVGISLVLILISAIASQVGPRLTQIGVDEHILVGDLDGLYSLIGIYFLSIIVQYVAQYGQTRVTEMTGQYVMRDLRQEIFVHLQRLPLRYFDRTPVGRTMTRTTNDVDALNEFFTEGVVSVFMDLFTLIAIVAFMADMDWQLTLASCTVIPILAVATFYLQNRAMGAYRELRRRLARLNAYLQENITGIEVVQLFGRQQKNLSEFDDEHLPYRHAEDREIHYYAVFFPFTEFIGTVGMAVVVWYGAGWVLEQRIDLGVLVAFLQYVRRFFRPIMDISDRYALLQSAMAASERIFQLLDTPAESAGGQLTQPVVGSTEAAIEFDHVFFKYDPQGTDWILEDVSFRVSSTHSLALVGATGSGKTTIVNLLCRFYEVQEGVVKVDGVDVRQWDLHALRRRIGIVQQDVFLFTGDIAGNIRLGEDSIDTERVERVAAYVNADRFIHRLPGGYQQPVAEGGSSLSSGQRQLLSFARALAFDPQILVLDEATSSIDTETEQLIQDAISRLMRERTSVVIAHRLSTIRNADHILVLHHGQVREQGRHEELVRQGGIYARLHRLHYGAGADTTK
ncbi:MAG: ABC transporter ATP-binding protein [Gemmatimonadetes bacterium]|nr:ABC transporter ATP-binding protein [Gemmatimonadota bacterium]MBT7861970.1 ABC transporter ATP-binding protein [Gemmatimonadota bacterium]